MKLARELLLTVVGATAILFGIWAAGAAVGLFVVGFCTVAGCPL